MTTLLHRSRSNQGFTLIEVLVALGITLVVMASVFELLKRGQDSFAREPEVADMTSNARAGLDLISRDLTRAGYESPPSLAIMWSDGNGTTPDELTIVFSDPDVPQSLPLCSAGGGGGGGGNGGGGNGGGGNGGGGGGGCGTVKSSSTLWIDPDSVKYPGA